MNNKDIQQIFSNNLMYYLKKNNKSQLDLAKAIGVSNTTINNYVKGYNTPRMDKVDKICNYFGITRSDLLEEKYDFEEETPHPKGCKIPVLGEVAAGVPIEAVEDIIDYEEIPIEWKSKGDFFALQIKGDSMQPKMDSGDVVIVRKQSDADSGDTVIVVVNGDSATCKKIKKQSNGLMLIPTNPNYETIFYSKEDIESLPVTIIGKVVELRAKF